MPFPALMETIVRTIIVIRYGSVSRRDAEILEPIACILS
jgi:hypothetical protein